ncbi:hypothetical protein [Streptomyces sp. JJ36]|uniref:hypothetical protein n=1 Tax=Streptomyces sp. JJ36 TaxID=2736645 RepID=UPI001F1735C0|nr:hypothetical protein [Streptomyces sp. JJ36]MCF6526397.1 hypothetical protein [Streptomyces sp. JJ36]
MLPPTSRVLRAARTATAGLALALALSLTGCGEDREYAVPETVCGVTMPEDTVAPLLPAGERLTEDGETLPEKRAKCGVTVDDTQVLSVLFNRVQELYDPMAESESYKFTHRERMSGLPFPGKGALGDVNAMITAECGGSGPPYLVVDVRVDERTATDDLPERRDRIREFAVAYTSAAKKELGCAA